MDRPRRLAIALLLAALAGCSGEVEPQPPPESPAPAKAPAVDPAVVRAEIAQLEARVESQTTALAEAETAAEEAHAAFEGARAKLAETEAALAAARAKLSLSFVPDDELFRRVQSRLLEAEALTRVAIAAHVEDGIVTLRGRIPDEATRQAALAVVRGVAGVGEVRDEMDFPPDEKPQAATTTPETGH